MLRHDTQHACNCMMHGLHVALHAHGCMVIKHQVQPASHRRPAPECLAPHAACRPCYSSSGSWQIAFTAPTWSREHPSCQSTYYSLPLLYMSSTSSRHQDQSHPTDAWPDKQLGNSKRLFSTLHASNEVHPTSSTQVHVLKYMLLQYILLQYISLQYILLQVPTCIQ